MRLIQVSKVLLLVLAASTLFAVANSNVSFADDSLDGKTFSIKIKEHGKDVEATDDELIFKDGTLFSTDCEQYGFSAAPYEYRTVDGKTMFISSHTSEKEGETQWEGEVRGDEISGTMIWSKTEQDPIMYKYKGSLKK